MNPLAIARRHPSVFAALVGVALAFAAAPHGVVPLLFAAGALWVEAARLGGDAPDVKRGAKLGLVAGFAFHAIAFHWVVPLFTGHVPIPLPVAAVLAVIFWLGHSLPFVVAGAGAELLHAARVPRSVALATSVALAFDGVWVLFPWRPAEFVVPFEAYAQLADLSGPGALDFTIVLAGAATLEGLASRGARRAGLVALGLAACAGPWLYGIGRIQSIDALRASAPVVRVGAVQPNFEQRFKDDDSLALAQLDVLRHLTHEVEALGVDLTVWPETAYPGVLSRRLVRDPLGRRGLRHQGFVRGPVLFGALTGDGACTNRNSIVVMNERGSVTGLADKRMLLPFSEEIPFFEHLSFLHRYVPCAGFVAATGPSVVTIGGARPGILNCYEDLFPWYARDVARERADFLLNVSNDAWFFDTSEPHLHHMAARMRAIETRRDLVRVTNTGLTGHVDALGRRVDELPVWTRGVRVFEVRRMPGATSRYARDGDVFTPVLRWCVVAALVLACARAAWRRER